MIEISLPYIYGLATALEPMLTLKPGTKYEDVFLEIWTAQEQLQLLLQSSVFSGTVRSSRPLGDHLLQALQAQTANPKMDRVLEPSDVVPLSYRFSQFKIALLAELATFPTYFVDQQGGYDTLTLMHQSARLFPVDLQPKVPEALFDVEQAAKALAYEMPTACGFHVFRATEAVIRRYYTKVTGGKPEPKARNIGTYVRLMRQQKCGDEKILAVLGQMASLHRNPVIHPEVALIMDEAIAVMGMAHSAITAMLYALPDVPQTTATMTGSAPATIATGG